METQQIVDIIKATAGSIDSLISQIAFFFAIKAAANWLSISLPLLILFGIFLRVSSTLKSQNANPETVGMLVIIAWVLFAGTLFTGVRGTAHLIQAAVAPSVYTASEVGGVTDLLGHLKGNGK